MGCMRSSNELDGRNFHLRMMVQMRPARPMDPPIAIRMMMVLRCSTVTLPEEVEAAEVALDGAELVMVTGGNDGAEVTLSGAGVDVEGAAVVSGVALVVVVVVVGVDEVLVVLEVVEEVDVEVDTTDKFAPVGPFTMPPTRPALVVV